MENKIPTAEAFIEKYRKIKLSGEEYKAEDILIEFAKLHVQQALESAAIKAEAIPYSEGAVGQCGVDEDSILNAYPLEQIK